MEKEIKIEVPKGYEIDVEKSSFSKIVFKKIENKLPQSFEDLGEIGGWYINDENGDVEKATCFVHSKSTLSNGIYPTKELAQASVALAKLLHIRKAYVGDWEPDWECENKYKYCIHLIRNKINKGTYLTTFKILSFPNQELRSKFFEAPKIRELLEIAKPLL